MMNQVILHSINLDIETKVKLTSELQTCKLQIEMYLYDKSSNCS